MIIHSDAGPSGRLITAETCLVTGVNLPVGPGPSPGYNVPASGLYFNWNLAIISEDGRLVDLNGTVSKSGPPVATQPTINLPLSLSWNLSKEQPKPSTNRVLTLVGVWPCTDTSSTCSPDPTKELWVAHLLGSPGPHNPTSPIVHPYGAGCLAPLVNEPSLPRKKGDPDEHLRQFTVLGFDNQYVIYACLVSKDFIRFKVASFNVTLTDKDDRPLTMNPGGNTRQNVGKLYQRDDENAPNLATILAVQIQSLAASATPAAKAQINLTYIGCTGEEEKDCKAQVTESWTQRTSKISANLRPQTNSLLSYAINQRTTTHPYNRQISSSRS